MTGWDINITDNNTTTAENNNTDNNKYSISVHGHFKTSGMFFFLRQGKEMFLNQSITFVLT